jgi:hypothetical protein
MGTTSAFPSSLALWLGIGLVIVSPIIYMVQVGARMLSTPWYAAVLATIGAALVLVALLDRHTVWRIAAFALCTLLAGAYWYFLLSLSRVPAYTGPVSVGASFPAFHTMRADETSFDQDSLQGEQNSVLVFFRGRW